MKTQKDILLLYLDKKDEVDCLFKEIIVLQSKYSKMGFEPLAEFYDTFPNLLKLRNILRSELL